MPVEIRATRAPDSIHQIVELRRLLFDKFPQNHAALTSPGPVEHLRLSPQIQRIYQRVPQPQRDLLEELGIWQRS